MERVPSETQAFQQELLDAGLSLINLPEPRSSLSAISNKEQEDLLQLIGACQDKSEMKQIEPTLIEEQIDTSSKPRKGAIQAGAYLQQS